MRLVTARSGESTFAGLVVGETVHPLPFSDVGQLLREGRDNAGTAALVDEHKGETAPVAAASVEFATLVSKPGKIVCVGLNYRRHIAEMGREAPEYPTLFAKYPEALIGACDPIVMPAASSQMDWEAELAVVIGARIRRADESSAAQAIAGYSIVNDVTARDWQSRTLQWLQGKTFQSTCPFGPALVTPDEVDDASDLEIRCEVDGEVMQQARTSDLVFRPAALVSYVSTILTLEPGDVIATGTPGGVGSGMRPPRFLQPGAQVRTVIEGLGECVNSCMEEAR